jgi:hypothetical protein
MADVLNYLGQSFTILAQWLERLSSPVPWPLVIAFLFLPFVAAFRTLLWFMRGTTWPVSCKYYHTQQRRADKPCRTPVPGEWHYCRHHGKPKRMSDGHLCDPRIQRWQARARGGAITERQDVRGVGFVRLMADADTLLFHRGLARRPRDVLPGLRELPRRWRQGWHRLRQIRPADLLRKPAGSPLGIAARMPRVVKATRLTVATYAAGLAAVGTSAVLHGAAQTVAQYMATLSFIFAWEAFRFGVWNDEHTKPRWLRASLADSSKAFGALVALAVIGNILSGVHAALQAR